MVSVAQVMTGNPVCVKPGDLVTHARSVMRNHGYRALPVVEGGKLVGLISRGDVMLVTSTKANLTVAGIMNTILLSVKPEDDVKDAAKVLIKSGIRQLPVVESESVVGIISSMDILKSFLSSGFEPKTAKVSDVMTETVISCSPDDDLSVLWSKMMVRGFSGLPVVKEGVVKGMITRTDILKHFSARISKESGKPRNVKVGKIMNSPAVTIRPVDKVSKTAHILVEKKIMRMPVVDDKSQLLGILDIEDVIRAYL